MDPILRLVGELRGFEHLLRAAYASGGRLAAAAAEAQADRQMSVTCGHQVLGAISVANVEVSEAIARSADAHRLLERLGKSMGLDVSAYGDEHKYPGNGARGTPFWTGADGRQHAVDA